MPRTYKIATLPGDGIGREVIPEALRVIDAAMNSVRGVTVEPLTFEGGGEFFKKNNKEWTEEAEEFTKNEADAVLLGAVGAIDNEGRTIKRTDGHLAGYSLVIGLRIELELFANVRPVKLYKGVPSPLAGKDYRHVNMTMIRENTEGLYAPQEAPARSMDIDMIVDRRVITKKASTRVARYAFERAAKSGGAPVDAVKRVTCVDKSNLLAGCQLFRRSFDEVGMDFPSVAKDYAYVDAFTQWLIRKPEFYNVVVAPNAFGDIITDLGAAVQGGLGMAPGASIGEKKAVFEPVHGSAPKYYGRMIVNPIAAILSGTMMLEWLGSKHKDQNLIQASQIIEESVADVLQGGRIRTYDLCIDKWSRVKPSSTSQVTDAIIKVIQRKSRA